MATIYIVHQPPIYETDDDGEPQSIDEEEIGEAVLKAIVGRFLVVQYEDEDESTVRRAIPMDRIREILFTSSHEEQHFSDLLWKVGS